MTVMQNIELLNINDTKVEFVYYPYKIERDSIFSFVITKFNNPIKYLNNKEIRVISFNIEFVL
jgi:hypothetical protein